VNERWQPGTSWKLVRHRWRLDKPWRIAGVAAIFLLLIGALAFGPVVRSVAVGRARARGVELEIGGARPGWFSVQLRDTLVQLKGAPAVRVRLERVVVRFTPWLSVRGIELDGGEVALSGAAQLLLEQLQAWRAAQRSGVEPASGARARLALRATGLTLRWTGSDPSSAQQLVSGIYFERGERERAGFDSARFELAGGALEVTQAAAEFEQTPEGTALSSADVAQIVGRIPLSAGAALAAGASPAAAGGEESADDDTDLPGTPAAGSIDAPAPASHWLAPVANVPWEHRKGQLAELRRMAARALSDGAVIQLDRVQLELARGNSVLNVGPAPFRVERRGALISASFTPPAEKDGKQLTVQGRLPLEALPLEASFEGGPISLATLGVHEGDFGLLGVGQSELTMATRITLSPEGMLDLAASGRLERLALRHPALAPEPVQDMDLGWRGQIRLDLERHRLEIKDAGVSVEGVRAELGGSLESTGQDLRVALRLRVPATPCQGLLRAAPPALLPQLQGLRLGGTLGLDARVDFDTAAPKDTQVEWNLQNECKVLETPAGIDPARFRQPFVQPVMDVKGNPLDLTTGPTTTEWVPMSDISPNMETALIICEDSRFFTHHGFDDKAIRDSIGDNLRAGHFVRGASTLSMQLAKNLYLSREKTLSRKLQEAVFTLLLEERLSKQDILELYLNVVEFGRGIYGIRNAAMYYFNSHPSELSLAQAMYLGSVLPAPKANHFQPDGALRKRWAEHLQVLMRIAHKIHRISDEELAAGLSEQIVRGQSHVSPDKGFLNDG
jgi:monofunctional biosynthetic peptidoglycan transglycosylase